MYYFILDSTLLPITPEKLNIGYDGNNKTLTLINDGEINVLKSPKLKTITFEALLPNVNYPFSNGQGSKIYTDKLKSLWKNKKPFQFIIARFKPNNTPLWYTNKTVSLESFELEESYELGIDVLARINLKEYKSYGTKILQESSESEQTVLTATVTETRSSITSPMPTANTNYTVKTNDTLWSIAKRLYDDGSKYQSIAKANSITNPTLISGGANLIIPKG